MKIQYKDDDPYANIYHMLKDYDKHVKEIQIRWQKIETCKIELLKLYSEQANITPPKNDLHNGEEWGLCINSSIIFPVPAKMSDCSVGMVRKLRDGVSKEHNDGTCNTCPYFIPRNSLEQREVDEIINHLKTKNE